MIRPRRSVLYVPGARPSGIAKARTLDADAVIFDLEDAVAPEAKETARAAVVAALAEGGFGARELIVRINAPDTSWAEADIAAIAREGAHAVLLPKVSDPEVLAVTARRLADHGAPAGLALWAMIETPRAILALRELAAAAADPANRLAAFVMGTNDLAADARVRPTPGRAALVPWLAQTVIAARAAGIAVLDGVHTALDDAEGFAAECRQGRDMGFDGKTLIHPRQIATANAVFAPDPVELEEAQAIVDAFADPAHAGRAVLTVNGRMVERLHEQAARRLLDLAAAIAARA